MMASETSTTDQPASEPRRPDVELSIPAALGFEKVARSAAAAVAEQMGFSEDRVEDLKTAVAEACMNAIEHGNGNDATSHVHVLLHMEESHLQVTIRDDGLAGGLPDPLPTPGIPDSTRGWGLFFITRLMDEVAFKRLPEGGTQVQMVIHLQPTGAEALSADPPGAAPETADETDEQATAIEAGLHLTNGESSEESEVETAITSEAEEPSATDRQSPSDKEVSSPPSELPTSLAEETTCQDEPSSEASSPASS